MADILLVQPPVREYQVVTKNPIIPLSLLNIASLLHKDYDIKILDQRLDKNWKKELLKELKKNPLCVGLTAQTGEEITHALKTSEIVKKSNDSTKVIWGGSHASLLPKQTLEHPNIDLVVKGEGEITFYELIKALEKNKSLKGIKGVWYKENTKIKSNPDRPFLDLNKLPTLPYDLIKIQDYFSKRDGKKSVYIETSRGCLNNCSFCYNLQINKKTYRCLNKKNTLTKIDKVVKDYGIEYLRIVDDNYFADKKRVLDISKQIINDKLNIQWEAMGAPFNMISQFSIEELKILKSSGCDQLSFGIESGSKRILKLLNKNIKISKVITLNRLLKKLQIKPKYFFVYGFPTETVNELRKTADLILTLLKDNHSASAHSFCYTPIPNTPLFYLAVKEGFVPPKTLEDWSKYDRDVAYKNQVFKKTGDLVENLNLASKLFISRIPEKKGLSLIKKLYRPIAKFRMNHLFFKFFLEKRIHNWAVKQK